MMKCNIGVPQGSIPGLMMYFLFIDVILTMIWSNVMHFVVLNVTMLCRLKQFNNVRILKDDFIKVYCRAHLTELC